MGCRSNNTSKNGKFVNPTDQARKAARKKELKKNKKLRNSARVAILKGKDPSQIIGELEKIDEMEYNVMQPPPYNAKVLEDKRKKLKIQLDKVLKLYADDDEEKCAEIKKQMNQYERGRNERVLCFQAVRHAQKVQVDEIPLPSVMNDVKRTFPGSLNSQIPLPVMPQQPAHIFPPHTHYMPQYNRLMNIAIPTSKAPNKEPPGVPPFAPPDITSEHEDSQDKSEDSKSRSIRFAEDSKDGMQDFDGKETADKENMKKPEIGKVKPTTLQQKMLAMAGQNIDQFMREMEVVQKKRETERAQDLNARLSLLDAESDGKSDKSMNKLANENIEPPGFSEHSSGHGQNQYMQQQHRQQQQYQQQHAMPPMGMSPHSLLYRPPPPPPMHRRMPPPPPPRIERRLPPGPPPGMPQILRPGPQVLSAAPQLINRKDGDVKSSSTIEAKPKMRNLVASATRFLPTSLRVKRNDKRNPSIAPRHVEMMMEIQPIHASQTNTKDDAYMQFMNEMQNLL